MITLCSFTLLPFCFRARSAREIFGVNFGRIGRGLEPAAGDAESGWAGRCARALCGGSWNNNPRANL